MEQQPILKKTFYTVAVMLAAWVAFVGTMSILAVLVTSRAVGAAPEAERDEKGAASAPAASDVSSPSHGAMKSNAPGAAAPHRI